MDIREDLINKVKSKIEKEIPIGKDKELIRNKYKDKKNGIYFLYGKDNKVIYIGMVGNGDHTSFYHRMYEHGSGAHCKKDWFVEVEKFIFKSFCNLSEKELKQIERLMIFAKGQPKYNDCYINEEECKELIEKL